MSQAAGISTTDFNRRARRLGCRPAEGEKGGGGSAVFSTVTQKNREFSFRQCFTCTSQCRSPRVETEELIDQALADCTDILFQNLVADGPLR